MTPRYGGVPVLRVEGSSEDPAGPLLRQRRRFADVLAGLDAEQWASPTRCERWSVQNLITHLVGMNEAWTVSFAGGRSGAPTTFFRSFDPVATPPRMVDAVRGWTPAETLDRFVATTEAVAQALAGLDEEDFARTGESPLGHVALGLVAWHALWDGWVHERDVLLPLGLVPVEEADEVTTCLTYAAALGPALLAVDGSTRRAVLAVDATEPCVRVVVEVGPDVLVRTGDASPGAVLLTGLAVDLVEGLSLRMPLAVDVAAPDRWLLGGLAAVFDAGVDAGVDIAPAGAGQVG
ncbi:MAG: maleylpyruvate isomerase N-terminal domain-containing protein [Pseudonocardia sp.]